MIRRSVSVSLAALALAGCTLEPKYVQPAAPVPASFPTGGAYPAAQAGTPAPDIAWADFFTDPRLKSVIGLALKNNRDLRVAALNIITARETYRVQRADLFPTISATGSAVYEHTAAGLSGSTSTSTTTATGTSSAGVSSTSGTAVTSSSSGFYRIYTAELGLSDYELDVFGRVRSLTKQAYEQYLSTSEARRSTQISLIAEVATDYLTLAADRQRLKTAHDTVKADQQSLTLTQARFRDGIVSEIDVRQAETTLAEAQSDVATYTTTAEQDVNALNLLVGSPVSDDLLPEGLDDHLLTQGDLPAGLSSDVLLQRPDVLEAEHTLRADNADIGAARAAFFPSISLTADGGSESLYLSKLFASGSGIWTLAPNITLPIFNGGRNRANLRLAKAQRDIAVAQYESAIQTAFRDVANALAQRGQIGALLDAQERLAGAAGRSLTLAQARYRSGSDTYLNVLTSQLTVYNAQQTLISARLTRATNLVALYRALGGGVK